MSEEQESEPCDVHGWRDCKRCRNRNPVSDWASAQREIARLNDELRTVQVEVDRLRAQLAEIGETREEYAVRNEGHEAFCATPQGALRVAREWTAAKPGAPWQANRRLVGKWREIEQESDRG